jgi:hypothetical protein
MFKTMALLIALLLSIGIISSPDQVTDEMIQEYENCIIILDGNMV